MLGARPPRHRRDPQRERRSGLGGVAAIQPLAPGAVRWIARKLEEAGHETWAVGGAIRDAVLGHVTADWDLATRARPEEVRALFRRTVPIGVEHGTVGVLARDGTLYEVTTFRKDVETDGRHAVVAFAESIEDDLARRDFTINALAWHPLREELFDPFGGVGDIEAGILRTVGVADERFREDYLRILRAIRFAGRFELEVENDTWQALASLVDHLPALSAERLREELIKVLDADPSPSRALQMYADSGARAVLYPELEALDDEPWMGALGVTDFLARGRPHLRLAALVRPLEPAAAAAVLVRLRLSNALTDRVARLARAAPLPRAEATPEAVRRWLSRHVDTSLSAAARLELADARRRHEGADAVVEAWRRAKEVARSEPPLEVSDLVLDGRDLIGLGLRPGPHFGTILDELLEWVLQDPTRNERSALESKAMDVAGSLEASHAGEGTA